MSLSLSPLFGDHAVLQRDHPIPVWGRAEPGEEVRVRLAGHQARVVAGGDGTWLLRLPPLPAGGPHELLASSASVCRPVALRYAWADNPEGCNLVSVDGLPASPFRTDRW